MPVDTQAFVVVQVKRCGSASSICTLLSIGYEPKVALISTWVSHFLAMERRSSSVPLMPLGNPFWSERTQGDFRLAQTRPSDLPRVGSELSLTLGLRVDVVNNRKEHFRQVQHLLELDALKGHYHLAPPTVGTVA